MTTATARVILGQTPVGTAWRFHDRYALTAAHCVDDKRQLLRLPQVVHVQFPGEPPLPAKTRVHGGLDAALLEFEGTVPAGIPVLELARPPREPMLSSYEWRGIAYPRVSGFRELLLTGWIRGYVHADDGPALQISFDDIVNRTAGGGSTLLSNASGAAVTYQQRAVGLVQASLTDTQIGHAVPIDRVARAFAEVGEQLREYPSGRAGSRWRELDRDESWDKVVAAVAQPQSRALMLHGAAGECHQTFLQRLESYLAGPPPRGRYLPVRWPDVGWTVPDFIAAISVAIDGPDDGDEQRLRDTLARAAAGEKLVLVHDVLDPEKHADDLDTVIGYYREVMPRLAETPGHGIVWIQPFEWTDAKGCAKAGGVIGSIERKSHPKVEALDELVPMTVDDLKNFGASDGLVAQWLLRPTTREAYRLLKDTKGGSHGR